MKKTTKSRQMVTVKTDRINGWGMHHSGTRRVLVGLLTTLCIVSARTIRAGGEQRLAGVPLIDGSTP